MGNSRSSINASLLNLSLALGAGDNMGEAKIERERTRKRLTRR
jgi:hypothetical protein